MVVEKTAKKIEKSKKLRSTKGIVVSDKMDKTIVVAVNTLKKHPKYHKRYLSTKKYKVHDSKNKFKVGDEVEFVSTKPISKDKKWRAIYNGKNTKNKKQETNSVQ